MTVLANINRRYIMKNSISKLIFIIILSGCTKLYAQQTPPISISFNQLSINSGLPGRVIKAIVQDNSGFLWIATPKGLAKYDGYRFKVFKHISDNPNSLPHNNINALHLDKNNTLWVATEKGLSYYKSEEFINYRNIPGNKNSLSSDNIYSISSDNQGLWIATDTGLNFLSYQTSKVLRFNLTFANKRVYQEKVYQVINLKNNQLMIAGKNLLATVDKKTGVIEPISSPLVDKKQNFRTIHQDRQENIWIGSDQGLYYYNMSDKLHSPQKLLSDIFILSISSDQQNTWVGTLRNGLLRISKDKTVTNYQYDPGDAESLRDNIIPATFVDSNSTLWLGTFNNGINSFNTNNLKFGRVNNSASSLNCLDNLNIYNLYQQNEQALFIGTDTSFFEYDFIEKRCFRYKIINANGVELKKLRTATINEAYNQIWVGTSNGLFQLNRSTKQLQQLPNTSINIPINTLSFLTPDKILLGTTKGSKIYDLKTNQLIEVTGNSSKQWDFNVHQYAALESGEILLATNRGVYKLNSHQQYIPFIDNKIFRNRAVNCLLINDYIWIGLESSGYIYQYNFQGELVKKHLLDNLNKDSLYPMAMLPDNENNLWISSDYGIYRLNMLTHQVKHFLHSDGLQSNHFIRNSASKTDDGKLYFGGRNGFNVFYPDHITENTTPPKTVLTQLNRFNKPVFAGIKIDNFLLSKPIEDIEKLQLSYKDYIMSLEFSGLHFNDSSRNQYAYKLEGFHKDWIKTDANNRKVILTNLPSGDYTLKIKSANKDGFWSSDKNNVSLTVSVSPAPWLSLWAYIAYTILFISGILYFIHYRTQSSIKQARELAYQVTQRTKEVNEQKELIEKMLERKNELFANISHEFRTPLTLILGPLEQELKSLNSSQTTKNLKLIKRNADRLLGMIEQILKLTELQKDEQPEKFSFAVNPILEAIVESFQLLAKSKNIELTLSLGEECNILISSNALEIILGNLISNSIKYIQGSGKVRVTSQRINQSIKIKVCDTGVGMSKAEQHASFQRFVRLPKTSEIDGTGIGLSIVKELVKLNHGDIHVASIEGQGSTFSVLLPITEQRPKGNPLTLQSINHLTISQQSQKQSSYEVIEQGDNLLIIEDNRDMRDYICSVLSDDYHCLSAETGKQGISLALEKVPDLIISDIMMPEINGYEIVRYLREDIRTSHIPIILLTAKGDKESRIQGWNENIDDYITKPFDTTELKSRINSILSVRNILRNRAADSVKISTTQNIPKKNTLKTALKEATLNKKEQAFVNKLIKIIEENYTNPNLQRNDISALMAISERQLQRKIKSLINKNPMDMLREYRLLKAAKLLDEGEQVSLVTDRCGFLSLSTFSKCFKAKTGYSPKQYQLRDKAS